jgi:hypothetical protein
MFDSCEALVMSRSADSCAAPSPPNVTRPLTSSLRLFG